MLSIILNILFLSNSSSFADCVLYKGSYTYEAVAHFKQSSSTLYAGQYSHTPLANIRGEVVYNGGYSYQALAHLKGDNKVYEGAYSYHALAHIKANTNYVYEGSHSYQVLVHSKNNLCTKEQLLLGTAALLLLF